MNDIITRDLIFCQDPDTRWYVELPEWTGSRADLEMVMGADDMLNYMAEGENKVRLIITEEKREGFDTLVLDTVTPDLGGGYYILKTYKGIDINLRMWLCGVTEFVFEKLPKEIYISKT